MTNYSPNFKYWLKFYSELLQIYRGCQNGAKLLFNLLLDIAYFKNLNECKDKINQYLKLVKKL